MNPALTLRQGGTRTAELTPPVAVGAALPLPRRVQGRRLLFGAA